jgi:hypothetical protein
MNVRGMFDRAYERARRALMQFAQHGRARDYEVCN